MSGLISRVKQMFGKADPGMVEKAASAVETNVSDERVDQALGHVPGGDRVRDHVPDNVGEKAADAMRDLAGDDQDKQQG